MSSPPLKHFAAELKLAREAAGMTQEDLAKACHYSKATVAMVETCQRPPTREFAERVDKTLDTGGRFDRMRRDLIIPEVNPDWFVPWVRYESEATEIRWFEPLLVPGLLQTEAYATALVGDPERVAARLERQAVLDRAHLTAIIAERILYERIGDSATMAEQLHSLATTTRAVVHVLPAGARTYAGTLGSFILALVDGVEVAYTDTPLQGFVVTKPGVLSDVRKRWEALATEALPWNLSQELIMKEAEKWKSEP